MCGEDGEKCQPSDDEKCCIFVTKDKRNAIILTMSYIEYLQCFDSKSDLEFLILDCNI